MNLNDQKLEIDTVRNLRNYRIYGITQKDRSEFGMGWAILIAIYSISFLYPIPNKLVMKMKVKYRFYPCFVKVITNTG